MCLQEQYKKIPCCEKHMQPYQAYCIKDSQLLCIECVIGDEHKKHATMTMAEASQQLLERLKIVF